MWKTGPEESAAEESSPVKEEDPTPTTRVASFGPSLVSRGTLSGQEDLLIEGQVESEFSLRKHSVIGLEARSARVCPGTGAYHRLMSSGQPRLLPIPGLLTLLEPRGGKADSYSASGWGDGF